MSMLQSTAVFDLYNAKGVAVYTQFPSSATYYDRYGSNSVSGHVHIANNSVVGVLPYVSQSEFVNGCHHWRASSKCYERTWTDV